MLAYMRKEMVETSSDKNRDKNESKDDGDDRPQFGLLIAMEIFRSEMEFAMQNKGAILIKELKEAGAWPFSDLSRRPLH